MLKGVFKNFSSSSSVHLEPEHRGHEAADEAVMVSGNTGHVSRVTCHVSRVKCHVSRVMCHVSGHNIHCSRHAADQAEGRNQDEEG